MAGPSRRAFARSSALLAVALTGCAQDSDDSAVARDNPVITLNEEANAWPTAEVAGTLDLRDGCLLIDDSVAVFPFGTTWRASEVVFDDGSVAEVGTEVRMGGGFFQVEEVDQDALPIVPMDEVKACAQRTGVSVFVWARP